MQVVKNKYFLLNPEKNFGVDPSCRFREKLTFNSENNVTEPKATLYQLKSCYQVKEQFLTLGNHGFRKSETDL